MVDSVGSQVLQLNFGGLQVLHLEQGISRWRVGGHSILVINILVLVNAIVDMNILAIVIHMVVISHISFVLFKN